MILSSMAVLCSDKLNSKVIVKIKRICTNNFKYMEKDIESNNKPLYSLITLIIINILLIIGYTLENSEDF